MVPLGHCAQPRLMSYRRESHQLGIQTGLAPTLAPTIYHATKTPSAPGSIRSGARNASQGTTSVAHHLIPATDFFGAMLAGREREGTVHAHWLIGVPSLLTQP